MFFETIPQIILQIRILFFFRSNVANKESLRTIMLSIAFAMGHGILEILILCIEAYLFEQSFLEYFVICFNGRLGWVPKLHKFKDPEFIKRLINKSGTDEEL